MRSRLFLIAAFFAAFPFFAHAEVTFEGDIAFGGSYNSNMALLSSEDRVTMDTRKAGLDVFSLDLDAFLTLIPADIFSLEYTLFAAVPPHPAHIPYAFFNHSLAALFTHEFDEVDISYGVELGHLLVGFDNRLLDPQALFDLFWYAHESLSYYLSASFSYAVSLDGEYSYLTAPGFRFENGIYIYPVSGDRSFISVGVGERMFFFGEDHILSPVPPDPPEPEVWARRDLSETYLRLKGKYIYEGFSAEASVRYGFMYYLGADRWRGTPDLPLSPAEYEKTRIDHALRLKALLEYRFTELFSLQAYYQYLRNFSNMGEDIADYENDTFDQHSTGLMFRFVF